MTARELAAAAGLYAMVTLGGVIGSLLRWGVGLVLPVAAGGLPWPTFFANATGCFAIGHATLTGPTAGCSSIRMRQPSWWHPRRFTTFSSFSLEILRFLQSGDAGSAALYLVVSVVSWLGAVWLGDVLAWRYNNSRGA
jgi:CrcB protein